MACSHRFRGRRALGACVRACVRTVLPHCCDPATPGKRWESLREKQKDSLVDLGTGCLHHQRACSQLPAASTAPLRAVQHATRCAGAFLSTGTAICEFGPQRSACADLWSAKVGLRRFRSSHSAGLRSESLCARRAMPAYQVCADSLVARTRQAPAADVCIVPPSAGREPCLRARPGSARDRSAAPAACLRRCPAATPRLSPRTSHASHLPSPANTKTRRLRARLRISHPIYTSALTHPVMKGGRRNQAPSARARSPAPPLLRPLPTATRVGPG